MLAAAALAETAGAGATKASRKRAVAGAMKEVAAFLGNTPALARSSYVDPRVIDAYEEGRTIERATRRSYDTTDERQAALERATLKLLKESADGDHRRRGRHHPAGRRRRRERRKQRDARRRWRGRRDPPGRWPAILEDCIVRFPHGLATGDAGWTTGGDLPARWVIHVVGPNRHAGQTDRSLLISCYVRALEVADELGARTVAFPLVSAGVYGWPKNDAIAAPLEVFRARGHQGRGGAAGRVRPRDVRTDPGAAGGSAG